MVNKIMYRKVQNLKRRGFSKAEIIREVGLNKRTVGKYYDMSEKKYLKYIERLRYRIKIYESLKPDILEIYKENGFQQLEKSAVYDCLEEKHGVMPGKERSFRYYITYLIETCQINLNENSRKYYPVEDQPYGKQLQIDFGEYRTRSGLKLYIFAAVLSASRYKYCALQERPFTTLDLINHLLDCFEYFGGMPEELVIDQDSIMVVSENNGDIVYTKDFKYFIDEMNLKMFVCRKSDPESKGKIENLIKFVKRNFLKLRDFKNIAEARERLFEWLARRANGKISLATYRIPKEMFSEEKKYLNPLRNSIYRKEASENREPRKADDLGQISVSSCKYPVPEEYRGKDVEIYKTEDKLFIYDLLTGENIKEHDICHIPGSRVPNRGRYHRNELKQKELKKKLNELFSVSGWNKFVDKNYEIYPRYFRDQYNEALKKFSDGIKDETMEQAVKFCLENKTYSMANLWDTYQYYKREMELMESSPKLKIKAGLRGIPAEKKSITVQKRDIAEYRAAANI